MVRPSRASRRIATTVFRTGKKEILQILKEIDPSLKEREAAKAFDMITSAINAWLMITMKDFPKGIHAKLSLNNAFCLNICWMKGKQDKYPDYVKIWTDVCADAHEIWWKNRTREYRRWAKERDARLAAGR